MANESSIPAGSPRTRRAILAAAVGTGAAAVAGALARPLTVAAANGDAVTVGNQFTGSLTTQIVNNTNTNIVIEGTSNAGGIGVEGDSNTGYGVYGDSTSGTGTYGISSSGVGVGASSDTNHAVDAYAGSAAGAGVRGGSNGGSGVYGFTGSALTPKAKTGVYGEGNTDSLSRGVWGSTAAGQGVRGEATTSGVGVYAAAPATGIALRTAGKVIFSRSGRVSMAAGTSSKTVSLAGVTTGSLVFAVLATSASGRWVRAVVPHSGSFTIYLNTTLAALATVSWFVLN
ncbi:MAG TPA: hypothetical protein VKR30_02560 [Candidatus Limnocylindrales bacterium]|nr:hypothetical protein [Candidatus Limnocylindrales bacterium]